LLARLLLEREVGPCPRNSLQLEDVQEEMLYHIYMTATKPYYFPVVIVPMLIGAVSQTINKVSKPALPVTLPFRYHTKLSSS